MKVKHYSPPSGIEVLKSCFGPSKKIATTSGIYVILCTTTNKFYVGSAFNLKIRKDNHFSALKTNRHLNKKLLHAVNKYGIENFFFIPIEYCKKPELLEREQYFINFFNAFSNGYNQSPNADIKGYGRKISEETKRKISDARKGRPAWNKGIAHTEADKIKMRGPRPQFCGKNNSNYGKKISKELRHKLIELTAIEFAFYAPNGKFYKGKNLHKFCREIGFSNSSGMNSVWRGKVKQNYGWIKAPLDGKDITPEEYRILLEKV